MCCHRSVMSYSTIPQWQPVKLSQCPSKSFQLLVKHTTFAKISKISLAVFHITSAAFKQTTIHYFYRHFHKKSPSWCERSQRPYFSSNPTIFQTAKIQMSLRALRFQEHDSGICRGSTEVVEDSVNHVWSSQRG